MVFLMCFFPFVETLILILVYLHAIHIEYNRIMYYKSQTVR